MTELQDPQLTAFWAADPSVLQEPELTDASPPTHSEHDRIALDIAAAVLAAFLLVRRQLLNEEPDVVNPAEQGRRAWAKHAPLWLRMVLPAIQHAYALGRVENLTDDELQTLATDYASKLGDYLSDTSADALTEGLNRQLSQKWNEKIAWHRAATAYGLDRREMRAYVDGLMLGSKDGFTDVIPIGVRTLLDKAMLARAQRVGDSESWTATQTGQALGWLMLYRAGRLPEGARREWDVSEQESTCGVCRYLHEQQVPLDEPFILPDGGKVWAPQAHPKCRCETRLVLPEQVEKAYNPKEQRESKGTRHGGRWVKVAERTAAREDEVAPVGDQPSSPFRPATPSPFARRSPFSPRSPFTSESPFTAPAHPFASASPVAGRSPFTYARRPATRTHRIVVVVPARRRRPEGLHPYYLAVDDFHALTDDHAMGTQYPLGDLVDFTFAASRPTAQADVSPWNLITDDMVLPARVPMDMTRDQLQAIWSGQGDNPGIAGLAYTAWHDAINDATDTDESGGVVDFLDDGDLHRIAALAGYVDESGDAMRSRIRDAARSLGTGDNSLACAYADYVTYVRPSLLGSTGRRLEGELERAEDEYGVDVRGYLQHGDPEFAQQVFAFEQGFHPGTPHDKDEARLAGGYAVTGVRYRSAIHDLGRGIGSQPLRIGIQEAYVEPYVDRHGFWIPGQAADAQE